MIKRKIAKVPKDFYYDNAQNMGISYNYVNDNRVITLLYKLILLEINYAVLRQHLVRFIYFKSGTENLCSVVMKILNFENLYYVKVKL